MLFRSWAALRPAAQAELGRVLGHRAELRVRLVEEETWMRLWELKRREGAKRVRAEWGEVRWESFRRSWRVLHSWKEHAGVSAVRKHESAD